MAGCPPYVLSVSYSRIEPSLLGALLLSHAGLRAHFQYPTLGSNHRYPIALVEAATVFSLSVSYSRIEPSLPAACLTR